MFNSISLGERDFFKAPIPVTQRGHWELYLVYHGEFGMIFGQNQPPIYRKKPSAWLMGPECFHGKTSTTSPCHVVNINSREVPELAKILCPKDQHLEIPLEPKAILSYLEMARQLEKLSGQKHPLSRYRQELIFQQIFLFLFEQLPVHRLPFLENQTRLKLDRAFQWFDEHMHEGVDLEKMATYIHLSESHFRRLVKEEFGESAKHLMQKKQREKAEGLLAMGQYSMEHISEACGFGSAAAFSRAFKRWTGKNPKDMRAKINRS